jgi:hypothetical protein
VNMRVHRADVGGSLLKFSHIAGSNVGVFSSLSVFCE